MKMLVNQIAESQAAPAALEGKMGVVVTVLSIIFGVIVAYLMSMDRRLRKMEHKENNK